MKVQVRGKSREAQDVVAFELAPAAGQDLPTFAPGAHIDVTLPNGMIRQYSLCNGPDDTAIYRIAVHRSPVSRGGSLSAHDDLEPGDWIDVGEPRNLFALDDTQDECLLFAAGIGITPIIAMAERLFDAGRRFSLHYSAKTLAQAAFLPRLRGSGFASRVATYFSREPVPERLDITAALAAAGPDTQIYVCGPQAYTHDILSTARHLGWREDRLHYEAFSGLPAAAGDQSFSIRIASTGEVLTVPPEKTVLQVLTNGGVDIASSCEQGICGTCLTGVIDGIPCHRDHYLTDDEKAANSQFLPCCSRAVTGLLVLDL